MIDFTGIAQQKSLQHLSGSELVDGLRKLNDFPEIKEVIESLIPFETINGQKVVNPSFQNYLLNLDIIDAAEKTLNIERHSPESESEKCLAMSMFIGGVKDAFLSIINEINCDFSSDNVSWAQYIKGIESFGFEKVSSKEYTTEFDKRTEESVIFFHREHAMLWTIKSSHLNEKRVSGSNLYFCGKIKNKEIPFPDLRFSMGSLAPTGVFYFNFSMDKSPSHKLIEIFKHIEPVSQWGLFNVWDDKVIAQVKSLPNYVKMPILDYNIMSYDQNDYIKNERNSIVSIKAIEIIKKLQPEQQIYLNLFCRAQKFSDVNTVIMPSFIKKVLNELQENDLCKDYIVASIMYNMREFDQKVAEFTGQRDIFRTIIDTLKKDDLIDFYNTYLSMNEEFKNLYLSVDDQDFLFEKMN